MADPSIAPRRGPRRADDGFAAVETVIVASLLMAVFLMAIGAGRLESARLDVDTAASTAARAASLARSPAGARTAAQAEAKRSLASAGVACPHPQIAVDTAAFRPGGLVKVSVTCRAFLGDLVGMGFLPVGAGITQTSASPIDRYRQVDLERR
jgi:Flp pilus assembly protein TadG